MLILGGRQPNFVDSGPQFTRVCGRTWEGLLLITPFSVVDVLIHSGDIHNQSVKLSEIAPNSERFYATGKKRICGCCIRITAGVTVKVRIRVRDRVRISNKVRGRVKLINYCLITVLPIAISADLLLPFYPWPCIPVLGSAWTHFLTLYFSIKLYPQQTYKHYIIYLLYSVDVTERQIL